MLIIRLARHGRKKVPFYHLVVAEKHRPVQKRFVSKLGHYDPLANEGKGELLFDEKELEKYVDNGAQMSQTSARLLTKAGFKKAGKFVEQRVSKPKKEAPVEPKKEAPEAAKAEAEAPAPETTETEKPTEETETKTES